MPNVRLLAMSSLLCSMFAPRALASPALHICTEAVSIIPAAGSTIPANVPAFRIWRGQSYGVGLRPIESLQFELRDASGALWPLNVESQGEESHRLVPRPGLAPGEVVLSFLDECSKGEYMPKVTPAVRNDAHRYTIVAPSPFPTRLGALQARVIGYDIQQTANGDELVFGQVRFQLDPTPELAAFRPLLELELIHPDGFALRLWPEPEPKSGRFEFQSGIACFDQLGKMLAGKKRETFGLRARLPGVTQSIEPMSVTLEVDCSKRELGADPPPPIVVTPGRIDDGARADGGGCQLVSGDASGMALPLLVIFALRTAARPPRRRARRGC
jgi:hypothetical protein